MKLTVLAVFLGVGVLMSGTASAQQCRAYTGARSCPPNLQRHCTIQPDNRTCHCQCQPRR